MMAIDVKRLNEAEAIDLTRCEAKADKVMAERRLEAALLAAAGDTVTGERRWFALRSGFRGEIDLVKRLTDSNVDAVVPVKSVPAGHRFQPRRIKVVHKPVLRGLVFVRIVPSSEAFAGLLRVKDVAAIVGKDGDPYPIGDREMNAFMDLAQAGAFDERNTPHGLVVGSRVRIKVGPYADFEGVLTGYGRGRTARVLTYLFGREVTADVTLAHLEKLE
jgi:transcriptional antiterminator NusG